MRKAKWKNSVGNCDQSPQFGLSLRLGAGIPLSVRGGLNCPVRPADPTSRPRPVTPSERKSSSRSPVYRTLLRLALNRAAPPNHPLAGPSVDTMPGVKGTDDPDAAMTALLDAVSHGRDGSEAALLEVVYDELRAIAGSFFRTERRDHTLEPTALVHEAFVKLVRGPEVSVESRAHFIAIAARAMRRVSSTTRGRSERRSAARTGRDTSG